MRFFIALEIPPESLEELESVQDHLEKIIPGIRLTNTNKLHLTIAFLGEQPTKFKDDLIKILEQAVQNIAPFEITPAYIDGFPHLHQAHIFWVGVKGDIDKLFVIRERIKDGLVTLGLGADERRYIPHIAIAKVGNKFEITPEQEIQLQNLMMDSFSPIRISSLKLFESIPEEGFHTHNTLAEIPLVGTNQSSLEPEVL